ncbi:phenylacetate--CoA ligase [Thermosulfuriphilus ammonigenes]|uniref:Phenylacetate--CoA ligase n=1 Tax=Thermosulfuriphilus ammonigenes TaxID=1936021 RepID=A0A6G7PU84_9BACT|nr:AMP-binding protein [Thermosulfuriphilus ammonigenes]QIJ70993.1 phenylacetate--CoA ligase [Thermosulfuriphilus ammonigenes]
MKMSVEPTWAETIKNLRRSEMDRNIEHLSPEDLNQWQAELLQSTINRVYERVPFYRKLMDEAGIGPEEIKGLEDITRLPFTTRQELAANYPYDHFAVPLKDIIRIHVFPGVHERPVVRGYTRADVLARQELVTRFLKACGVGPEDIVQICLERGMAVWGEELRQGAESLGAVVIPPDPVSPANQLLVMGDFKTSVLITTPSYGLHLLDWLRENGVKKPLFLRRGIFVGETLTDSARRELEEGFGIEALSGYGIIEAAGPGMAYECEARDGLHLAADHIIAEIIDPESQAPLPPGEEGELVVTTLSVKANPLIRFRTGDRTKIIPEKCPCGRTTPRIAPISGRTDELLVIRGVKLSREILGKLISQTLKEREVSFEVEIKTRRHLQTLEIKIAMSPDIFVESIPGLHQRLSQVEAAILETVGLPVKVTFVEATSRNG